MHDFDLDYDRLKADVTTMRVNCVTKQDLKQDLTTLEERLLAPMNKLNGEVAHLGEKLEATNVGLAALKAQFDTELPHLATKADLHQFASSIRAWMITAMISMFFGFAGLGFVLVRALRPLASG